MDKKAPQMEPSKIVTDYVVQQPNSEMQETAKQIVEMYGSHCVKFVWAPNCGLQADPFSPPSGFAFVVNGDTAPLYKDVFSPKKMFYGTAAIPLDTSVTKTNRSSPLTEEYIIQNFNSIASKISSNIPQTGDIPFSLKKHYDPNSTYDKTEWAEGLGEGGAYAGVFSTNERSSYVSNKRLWLAVQAGNVDASVELYRMIEDAQPDWDVSSVHPAKITWKNFFFNNKETKNIYNLVNRTRERLLASLAESLDLDIKYSIDPFSRDNNKKILNPVVQTLSYSIRSVPGTNLLVYHSATADPSDTTICRNGLILNENPYIGPTILRGPDSHDKKFGSTWSTPEESYGAFPTGTGRSVAIHKANASTLIQSIPPADSKKFVYDNRGTEKNPRLAANLYRLRSHEFKKAEAKLGYQHRWGAVELNPVIVEICS